MNLTNCLLNKKYIIEKIIGGNRATIRLGELGVLPNKEVRVLRRQPFGPILIEIMGSKLMLGRGLASKIEVAL